MTSSFHARITQYVVPGATIQTRKLCDLIFDMLGLKFRNYNSFFHVTNFKPKNTFLVQFGGNY